MKFGLVLLLAWNAVASAQKIIQLDSHLLLLIFIQPRKDSWNKPVASPDLRILLFNVTAKQQAGDAGGAQR